MLVVAPVLDVERRAEGEPKLSLHDLAAGGVGDVFDEVSWVVVARHKVTVLKIELLPYCRYEAWRILKLYGPYVTVLVLLVLHSICGFVVLSLFADLQVDCLSKAHLVVQFELGSEYQGVILVLDSEARHYYY